MSINTHGIIPHCKSMLATRPTIHVLDTLSWLPLHSRLVRLSGKAASRRSARIADKTDERQTDGTNSDHPAARGSLRGRIWVLPRRLLPSRRARWDRRHTRIGPGRPRDRMAGARAYRGPLSLSFERPSRVVCNRAGGTVQTLAHRSCARSLRRAACTALLVIALSSFAVPSAAVSAIVPEGEWFIDGAAAVQIFDCSGQLCGRIIWLRTARDTAGRLIRDNKKPDPIFRQ